MVTLEKKHDTSVPDYNADDCFKIVDIYQKERGKSISKPINGDKMLCEFRLAYGTYKIAKFQDTAPSAAQLRKQHTDIHNKSLNLLLDLQNKTDTHFLNSMACAMAGTRTPITIEDEEYEPLMSDIYKKLESLGNSLKWLSDNLDLCRSDKFIYLHTYKNPNGRSPSENRFTKDLALILTKYLGGGGYYTDSHKNKYSGWKIDCLEYLLRCVAVTRSHGQIFAVLNEKKPKKKDNKTLK